MPRRNKYRADSILIGSSLACLVQAYLNNQTLIFENPVIPTPFEFLPLDFPIKLFNCDPVTIEMKSVSNTAQFGFPKIELWNRLLFVMSASGLLPFGLRDVTTRESDGILTVKTKSRNYNYECSDLSRTTNRAKRYKVYDWINVRSCGKHNIEYLKTEEEFVSELFFYPSTRHGAKQNDIDLLIISILSENDLYDFDFSETVTRIKAKSVMLEQGIRGPRNGRNPSYPKTGEKYKHAPIKLEHDRREIRKGISNSKELDVIKEFLKQNKTLPESSYLYKLNRKISQRSLLRT